MKMNRDFLTGAAAAALVLACVAATTVTTWQGKFVGTFVGNGAGLTNMVNTNYDATLFVASTNGSAYNSLAVTGASGDGIRLAVRGFTAQTNDVLQVQNASNGKIFGVDLLGRVSMKTNGAPPAGVSGSGFLWNSNAALYWVTTTKTNLVSDGL